MPNMAVQDRRLDFHQDRCHAFTIALLRSTGVDPTDFGCTKRPCFPSGYLWPRTSTVSYTRRSCGTPLQRSRTPSSTASVACDACESRVSSTCFVARNGREDEQAAVCGGEGGTDGFLRDIDISKGGIETSALRDRDLEKRGKNRRFAVLVDSVKGGRRLGCKGRRPTRNGGTDGRCPVRDTVGTEGKRGDVGIGEWTFLRCGAGRTEGCDIVASRPKVRVVTCRTFHNLRIASAGTERFVGSLITTATERNDPFEFLSSILEEDGSTQHRRMLEWSPRLHQSPPSSPSHPHLGTCAGRLHRIGWFLVQSMCNGSVPPRMKNLALAGHR